MARGCDTLEPLEQPAFGGHERGLFSYDIRSDIVRADASAAAIFGLDASQAISGLSLAAYLAAIDPLDRERVRAKVDGLASGPYELHYRTVVGSMVRTVEAHCLCVPDGDGRPATAFGLLSASTAEEVDDAERIADLCIAARDLARRSGNNLVSYLLGVTLLELREQATANDDRR